MLFYPIYPFCNYALKKQKLNQTPEPIYWWYWFQEELQIVLKSWRLRWLSPDDFFRFILIYESKDNSQTLNSANYTTLSCVSQEREKQLLISSSTTFSPRLSFFINISLLLKHCHQLFSCLANTHTYEEKMIIVANQ